MKNYIKLFIVIVIITMFTGCVSTGNRPPPIIGNTPTPTVASAFYKAEIMPWEPGYETQSWRHIGRNNRFDAFRPYGEGDTVTIQSNLSPKYWVKVVEGPVWIGPNKTYEVVLQRVTDTRVTNLTLEIYEWGNREPVATVVTRSFRVDQPPPRRDRWRQDRNGDWKHEWGPPPSWTPRFQNHVVVVRDREVGRGQFYLAYQRW